MRLEKEKERKREEGRRERNFIRGKGRECHHIIRSNNLIRIFSDFEILRV